MGDFWSGETDYDRNEGKRREEAGIDAERREKVRQGRTNDIFNPFVQNFGIGGSEAMRDGRLEGLERAKLLTGQSPYQIGQDYQDAYGNIKKRTEMSDTGSELLRANKAGAVADTRNQLQSQGVKGGAAVGAVSQVERAKSYDVNNQLMQNQRQAEMDYMNAAKANANFTQASEMNFGALNSEKDFKAPAQQSGGMGTVICTELFLQGYYDLETYTADQEYGLKMLNEKPHVYWGYRAWADYVVAGMKKSEAFSALVAFVALPWARNMAGDKNFVGALTGVIGEAVCGLIGRFTFWRLKYAN